ncbi:unnamed protein product, partial [Rotaria socialis]
HLDFFNSKFHSTIKLNSIQSKRTQM